MSKRNVPGYVTLCDDGVYRWAYDFDLYRNPTILFLIWKIFGLISVGMWAFSLLISCTERGFWWEGFKECSRVFLLLTLLFFILTTVGYYLYALAMGGKYCVLFEMDENGVRHTQLDRQFKKANVMSKLTMLAGALAGDPTATGAGLLAGSRNTMFSDFHVTGKVRIYPGRDVIKIDQLFSHNQVYAEKDDFDFVSRYIFEHVPIKQGKESLGDSTERFFRDGDTSRAINKRKVGALLLAAANIILAVVIITGARPSETGENGIITADNKVSSDIALQGYVADNMQNEAPDYDIGYDTAPVNGTVIAPTPADFDWFINGVNDTMKPQSDSVNPLSFTDILGQWKCLVIYLPDASPSERYFAFCNAELSGAEYDLSAQINWYTLVTGTGAMDQSGEMPATYEGSYADGAAWLTGPGNIRLESFYELDGKQYAIGYNELPDGDTAHIALVRP